MHGRREIHKLKSRLEMTEKKLPQVEYVGVDEVHKNPDNPRNITEEAVQSIWPAYKTCPR